MKARIHFVPTLDQRKNERAALCFLPGGPGLSSATLRSMDILARSFDLVYVDPPGTGGLQEVQNPSFHSIVKAIEDCLIDLDRPLILCGHSFGALYAVELAKNSRLPLEGFVSIAAPISYESYEVATQIYETKMTSQLSGAVSSWEQTPSNDTFAFMLSSYGEFYFSAGTAERGSELLRVDQVSNETFLEVLPVLSERKLGIDFVGTLSQLQTKKVMIAGDQDILFPRESLKKDADLTGCDFFSIQNAGHFVTFDQPEAVAALIENLFFDSKGGMR